MLNNEQREIERNDNVFKFWNILNRVLMWIGIVGSALSGIVLWIVLLEPLFIIIAIGGVLLSLLSYAIFQLILSTLADIKIIRDKLIKMDKTIDDLKE
ncbi:MAG: hypothetical protein MRZ86_05200 [Acidaminococcus sp.]|nr:hypothetical protein [Acidaminococcus sp.]MDD7398029.1 hypothetical protein [Bacillota bacterium]MDY4560034.1 hypothetical protein [Eubacteriales bacterium]